MIYPPNVLQEIKATMRHAANGNGKRKKPNAPAQKFAVGGCDGGCQTSMPCNPCPDGLAFSQNDCYIKYAIDHGCNPTVIAGGQYGVASGDTFDFNVQPEQSNFFLPLYVVMTATITGGSLTPVSALLTAVTIKNIPQEGYHETAPTVATTTGVAIGSYSAKTGAGSHSDVPGWPIAWGPLSRNSDVEQLRLIGVNRDTANVMDVRAELWGYELDALPREWKCGHHPNRPTASPR